MRTTLTLDDDVAILLERSQTADKISFKEIVNRTLRRGLADLVAEPAPVGLYSTPSRDLGRPLVPNLDNVAEVLAVAEGDRFQ